MAAAKILGLTDGFKFQPDDDEVIEFFLVPRLRGQQLPLNGIVIDDDPRSAPPWELFKRNGRDEENDAYFFAPGDAAKSRKVRACAGAGTWVGQKLEKTEKLRVGKEIIAWQKYRLNFHYGSGRSGSTGWVMIEYSVVVPDDCASFKVCHISFTGHGQKRKRVPDGYDDDSSVTHRQLQVAATSSSTATCYQNSPNPNGAHACHQDQEQFLMHAQYAGVDGVTTGPWIYQDQEHFLMKPQVYNDAAVDGVTGRWIYQRQEPFATSFDLPAMVDLGNIDLPAMDHGMMPPQMDQETCVPEQLVDYGTMPPPNDHDSGMPEQFAEYRNRYGTMAPPMEQESGMPLDPMLRQLLESMDDFSTTAQTDEGFGDYWASAGQDYRHHHVLPEQSLDQHQIL